MAAQSYLTATGRINSGAVLKAAHAEARANVARAAKRGVVRRYAAALKNALLDAWASAKVQRECAIRDAALAALPPSHAAILAERTAALMIDSTVRRDVELAAIDARIAAMGVRI